MKGRKRQLAVDTLGLRWHVVVHAASISGPRGRWWLLERCVGRFVRLLKVLADSAYGRRDLGERVRDELHGELEVIERPVGAKGFDGAGLRAIVDQRLHGAPESDHLRCLRIRRLPSIIPRLGRTTQVRDRAAAMLGVILGVQLWVLAGGRGA